MSQDFNSLLLFYSSFGDQQGLKTVAEGAADNGKFNVAFEAYYLLADLDSCIEVLLRAKRVAEAALFAKAYAPSRLPDLISQWGNSLKAAGL